jgi:hypothetical protein
MITLEAVIGAFPNLAGSIAALRFRSVTIMIPNTWALATFACDAQWNVTGCRRRRGDQPGRSATGCGFKRR